GGEPLERRLDLAGHGHLRGAGLARAGGLGADRVFPEGDQEPRRDRGGEKGEQGGVEPALAARPVPALCAGASSSPRNPSPHETRRPGHRSDWRARPRRASRTRERCGDDCSRRSCRMRSLALFAGDVLTVRKPVLREARRAGAPPPGQTGTMAGIVVVDDPHDPRLAGHGRLPDVRLRTAPEPAHGLFVAEGDKVIRRAVAAGFQVRSMLVTQDKLAGLADVAGACPGPVYLVSDEAAEQVTGYRVHRGALASMA